MLNYKRKAVTLLKGKGTAILILKKEGSLMINRYNFILFIFIANVLISSIYPVNAKEALTYILAVIVPVLLRIVIQNIHEKDNIAKVILSAISLMILLYNIFISGSVLKDIYPLQLTEPFYYAFYEILPAILTVILKKNFNQRSKNKED